MESGGSSPRVPPVRFRVMAPSERPEQETFVTVPFVGITSS